MINGWFISDVKDSHTEKMFLSMNVPNMKLVHLEDIELAVDVKHPDSIMVNGQWLEKPDFAVCTLVSVLSDNMEYLETIFRVLDHLESMDVYCFPKPEVMRRTGDKFRTAQLLAKAGVPTPITYVLTLKSNPGRVVEELGLPVVVKIPDGSKGKGVSLAHTRDELEALMKAELNKPSDILLAQEFIATSKGRDVRVTLADGELVFAIVRDNRKNDDFRSNVALGGEPFIVEPTEEMMQVARGAAKALGADLCGVDLLFTEDGFTVGEVNSFPGSLDELTYNGETLNKRYIRMLMQMIVKKVLEKRS